MLHDLGITTYRQLALLDDTQIAQVMQAVQIARAARMFSAQSNYLSWTDQARELHQAKYGEAP